MKNKLGFLDFSNTKERCKEDVPFNVDYIISELLTFGTQKKQVLNTRSEKKTHSAIKNDIENVQNENNVFSDQKNNSTKNVPSLGTLPANSNCTRNQRRMVC